MEYTVKLHKKNKVVEIKAEKGVNLLKFLNKHTSEVNSPCGGNGTCGKCRVLTTGLSTELFEKEKKLLGEKAVSKGYRLACYNKINSDIEIFLDERTEEAKIVTEGIEKKTVPNPRFIKEFIELKVPDINDQVSDLERILSHINKAKAMLSLDFIRKLPEIIRHENFKVTLVKMNKKLIAIESGNTARKLYGVAFDIGTTTIAAYLVDLATGKKLQAFPKLNPQKKYGADVISRIEFASTSEEALNEINTEIVNCINEVIENMVKWNNIERFDIYSAVFVGNTTMMHLLLKIPPKNIGVSPFVAGTTSLHTFLAADLSVKINPYGYATVFPMVSGYIGADTVAAVMASGMNSSEKISLMIDIGTNGEMVLGNKKWMLACSTAAGPAFEGANIRNGVGGVTGAIDFVTLSPDFSYTTIGNGKAIGICGSGIVDTIASLLDCGIIDETGRLEGAEKIGGSIAAELSKRLITIDGKNAFLLVGSNESASDIDIAITQKDVRELQNAKAAIAAGIKTLINRAQISINEIDAVYLAGGFGSSLNKNSAVKIGLLPKELKAKIQTIGNAAGVGAVEGLISSKKLKEAEKIQAAIEYLELSTCNEFKDLYIDCMMFEE